MAIFDFLNQPFFVLWECLPCWTFFGSFFKGLKLRLESLATEADNSCQVFIIYLPGVRRPLRGRRGEGRAREIQRRTLSGAAHAGRGARRHAGEGQGAVHAAISPCLSGVKHISNETFVVPVWQLFPMPLRTPPNDVFLHTK